MTGWIDVLLALLRLILGGLFLPCKLYFKPYAFRAEVAALAPDLPGDYSLWQARRHWRRPEFRRGLSGFMSRTAIALLWAPLAGAVFQWLGFGVDWWGIALGVAFGVEAFGVAAGVVSGVAFGVAAYGVAAVLTVTHLSNLLFQFPFCLSSIPLRGVYPRSARLLWRLHPVRWDDIILLPLPGLPSLLAALYRLDNVAGQAALDATTAHRFQFRAAFQALAKIAREDAQGVASLAALARFESGMSWLREDPPLPTEWRSALLRLRDISRETASALESDSATNRVRRLEKARNLLPRTSSNWHAPPGGVICSGEMAGSRA